VIPAHVAQRVRLPLGFLGAAAYIAFVRPTPTSLAIGVATAFLGLLIRAWAAGHIIKNNRLTTSGPYAFTRNPLYLGSSLLGVGFAMVAHWGLVALVVVFFALIYVPTMQRERDNLRARYGAEYDAYAAHVPLFVPRAIPYRPEPKVEEPAGYSPALYLQHREWQAALGFAGAAIWLLLRLRGEAP
jgi:protein-S-isoprenylcysteine O-methyltransferase Ste14